RLYISAYMNRPADGLGTQVRRLIELLDGDVEAIYRDSLSDYVPRYTPIMKALAGGTPRSIKWIAEQSSISHSAASQTITRMTQQGLLSSEPHRDRRSRLIRLSATGQKMLPLLEKQWRATQKAAEALDRELAYPLSELLAEAIAVLETKSFRSRIELSMKRAKT
ncbi:MAG: MarR family transcriptional regulator, partial [Pseudomonadota bacterium]